jgi:hypothetical protein
MHTRADQRSINHMTSDQFNYELLQKVPENNIYVQSTGEKACSLCGTMSASHLWCRLLDTMTTESLEATRINGKIDPDLGKVCVPLCTLLHHTSIRNFDIKILPDTPQAWYRWLSWSPWPPVTSWRVWTSVQDDRGRQTVDNRWWQSITAGPPDVWTEITWNYVLGPHVAPVLRKWGACFIPVLYTMFNPTL